MAVILEILKHDGPVRLGKLHFKGREMGTPNFFSTENKFKHDVYLTSYRNGIVNEPTVIDYGSLKANKEINEFGILPGDNCGFDVPMPIAKKSIENTVKFARMYKDYGAVIHGSKYPELRERCAEELKEHPLLVIANGSRLLRNPRLLVEIVTRVREVISPNTCLYFPYAMPHQFYLLAYMGIDMFDSIQCVLKARADRLITPRGSLDMKKIKELPCNCAVCSGRDPEDMLSSFEHIKEHNLLTARTVIGEIRESIRAGDFRNLVEEKASCDVNSMSILRLLDKEKQDFLEEYTRIY